jgi:hypothetical protein
MKIELWPEKAPSEKIPATFVFTKALDQGETIVSATLSVSLRQGVDPSPSSILDGAHQILAGGRVLQRIRGGIDGVSYEVRCSVTTSSGSIFLLAGVIPVREIS